MATEWMATSEIKPQGWGATNGHLSGGAAQVPRTQQRCRWCDPAALEEACKTTGSRGSLKGQLSRMHGAFLKRICQPLAASGWQEAWAGVAEAAAPAALARGEPANYRYVDLAVPRTFLHS